MDRYNIGDEILRYQDRDKLYFYFTMLKEEKYDKTEQAQITQAKKLQATFDKNKTLQTCSGLSSSSSVPAQFRFRFTGAAAAVLNGLHRGLVQTRTTPPDVFTRVRCVVTLLHHIEAVFDSHLSL